MRNRCIAETVRFINEAWKNRPYSWSTFGHLAALLIRVLILLPGCLLENVFSSRKINRYPVHRQPVFVLGHYRSGTTLLHKILACDPQFVYMDGMDALFPHLSPNVKKRMRNFVQWMLLKLKVKNQAFNDYDFRLDDPIEEDAYWLYANNPYSVFWGLIFPRNAEQRLAKYVKFESHESKESWKRAYLYLCQKISNKASGKPLLLKSPPNTGRVSTLLELFPEAKFINIYRNPYVVYSSMNKLITENIEKNYSLQKISDSRKQEIIINHYSLLMDRLEQDSHLLTDSNSISIRYEDFMEDPIAHLEKIYDQLNLGAFQEISSIFKNYLDRESQYGTSVHILSDSMKEQVKSAWGSYIERLGYQ